MRQFIAAALCAAVLVAPAGAQGWRRDARILSLTRDLAQATGHLKDRQLTLGDRLRNLVREPADDRENLYARLDDEAGRLQARARELEIAHRGRFEDRGRFGDRADFRERRAREFALVDQFRTVQRLADRLSDRFERGGGNQGAQRVFQAEVRPVLADLRVELPALAAWRDGDERHFDRDRM